LGPGVGLVRPLLRTARREIVAYLAALNQPYRTDSTNSDPSYTRNRIRSELLPLLAARYNPAAAAVLARLAEQADAAFRDEEAAAVRLLSRAELPRAGATLVFDRARLAAPPRRMTRAAFRSAWAREKWPLDGMNYDAWERLAGVAYGESRATDLPGRIRARTRGGVLQLGPAAEGE